MFTLSLAEHKWEKPSAKTNDADKRPFDRSKRIENTYANYLRALAKEINALMKKYKNSDEIVERLKKYSEQIDKWGRKTATTIFYQLNDQDKRMWMSHSKKMSRALRQELETLSMKELMDQYVDENARLISSMPLQSAERVERLVQENLKSGKSRSEGLIDQIMRIGNINENRAKLIARTEVSKASTALTKARANLLDLNWYVWRTSKDIRVRHSHKNMDNVLIRWDDPANPEQLAGEKSYGNYNPGEIFNCRCYAQPLIRLDDVRFPCKVYREGRIQQMSRNQFERLTENLLPSIRRTIH
jgi:SPP1 gp7 family putative phage head morphogenesis protein